MITENPTSRIVATVLAAFVALVSIATPAAAADDDAGEIFSGLNSARSAAGVPALVHNASLDAVALAWAGQMAANGAMSHNPDTGSQIPAGWSGWGENVAYGFATGAATNAGWTGSPSHYENMVGDFTDIGIAFVAAGGTTWAVEVFADYPSAAVAASTVVTPTAQHSDSTAADRTTAGAASSAVATTARPIGYLGLAAVPVAAALIVMLLRARRKRFAVEGRAG